MERVALLVEATGERLGCLLNPNTLVVERSAGVRPRQAATGLLTGGALADDPLLYTGGGRTSLTLDLLFDVRITGSSVQGEDVRDLTLPLWRLSEAAAPIVRFLWGKAWNVPGVVSAVAERLEDFDTAGLPSRSWLRMRLARVPETAALLDDAPPLAATQASTAPAVEGMPAQAEEIVTHRVLGEGPDSPGERLEDIAFLHYGNPALWRLLAAVNGIDDPGRVPAGTVLQIPAAPTGGG